MISDPGNAALSEEFCDKAVESTIIPAMLDVEDRDGDHRRNPHTQASRAGANERFIVAATGVRWQSMHLAGHTDA